MAYTSDDLITDIDRDSFQPAAQDHFSTPQKLLIADQEIHQTLAPLLVSLDSGYFLEPVDTTLVANQAGYDISRYAMWNKLRRVEVLDASSVPRQLDYLQPEQRYRYDTVNASTPIAFEMRHAQIVLVPMPSTATETLRQWIYRRPGRLVPTTSAAVVSSVNTTTGVVTYTGAPPASTFTASSSHDFYRGTSPFRRVGTACAATAQSGSTQTFSTTNAALLQAGDYVCVNDETVFPAVPLELSPFLKDLVIRSMARTHMDQEAYQVARSEIVDRARAAFMAGPGERVTGHPKKVSIPLSRVGRRRGVRLVTS